jgi:hypothetical protein
MRLSGKHKPEDIVIFSENLKGCYCEYSYSKELHEYLLSKNAKNVFDKKTNVREYWLDKENGDTIWRLFLK